MENKINYKYDETKLQNQLLEMMGSGLFSTEEMRRTEQEIKRMMCYYQCALMEIETKFSELGDERAWEYDILHRKVDAGELADEDEALRMAKGSVKILRITLP